MAEKEVHVTRDGNGVGTGLIAGILIAALAVFGLIFFFGGFDFEGGKDTNINIETPKLDAPAAPKVDVPGDN
jgi:hypothetical protein